MKREHKGYVDKIEGGDLLGWVWDPLHPEERWEVELLQDGEVVSEAVADGYREDLAEADIGDGMYGFQLPLPNGPIKIDSEGSLVIRVKNCGTQLSLAEQCTTQLENYNELLNTVELLPTHDLSRGIGRIERREGNRIIGWLVSGAHPATPVVLIDGKPANIVQWPIERPDVNEALAVDEAYGFEAVVPFECQNATVELYCAKDSGLIFVDKSEGHSIRESIFLQQLEIARKVASQPGAIGICCWDGGHNPIGRAKVLYDIATTKRPAVLLSFLFEEFGNHLWPPLENSPFPYLGIPWGRRHSLEFFLNNSGITFDTLWLCKPRFPTFELAAYFSHPETKLILDMDDNEAHFASSEAALKKPYGMPGVGMAHRLTEKIPARTVASISLQEDFGGELVRHVREPAKTPTQEPQERRTRRIGFIGTVRAHKNLIPAAKAIHLFGLKTVGKVEFHVYGDVSPESHREELEDLGVHLKGLIPISELTEHLAELDVILTGYPSSSEDHDAINQYQISSKIGDALSVGKPVLVPESPSVVDLENLPGVYLFNENNFEQALHQALTEKVSPHLPEEFTPKGGFAAFEKAEHLATSSPRAQAVLSDLKAIETPSAGSFPKSLVLLWKQNDAGIYGRRIDQIARLYKRTFPDNRVIILELLHEKEEKHLQQNSRNYLADAGLTYAYCQRKGEGKYQDADGVLYKQVRFHSSGVLEDRIIQFLQTHQLMPENTTFVFFPYIRFLEKFMDFVRPYPAVVDMVDNQLMWSSDKQFQSEAIQQFIGLFAHAKRILFNSTKNLEYFKRYTATGTGLNLEEKCSVVPNWYLPPKGFQPCPKRDKPRGQLDIVYSGNMSDRIDGELLKALVYSMNQTTLHLIGGANRAGQHFRELLDIPNVVYHGALSEKETLTRLSQMDLAIIPHKTDKVSTYMNPLKVGMFQELGMPVVAMDVPGISAVDGLKLCNTRNEFIETTKSSLELNLKRTEKRVEKTTACPGDEYMKVLSHL